MTEGPEQDREREENVARVAKILIDSGMATKSDVQACMQALQQIRKMGVQHTLLQVMLDKGVITNNQARAVQTAAQSGDSSGLLGGYQLIEKVGEGGMGAVYKAKQLSLDRIVAVKVLTEALAKDAEYAERFEREARIAARINHPNIVGAIDVGVAGGKRYFAMEFVEGRTVGDILDEDGKIPVHRSLEIMVQMSRALEAAWRNNLVHRDIKPDNILITPDGVAKLVDLGLAREAEPVGDSRLTMTGVITGTPNYISPEQATANEVDIRTDIYSLGATFYHMVTGDMPFSGEDPMEVIMARFKVRPPLASDVNKEVPYEVAAIIDTMMSVKPEDRYPDPRVLRHDLMLVASGEAPQFASESEESRRKAIEAAKEMPSETSMGLRPVRRRRNKLRTALLAGGLVTVVIAAALVGGVFTSSATGGASSTANTGRVISREEVNKAVENVEALIREGKLEEAVDEAEQMATRLAGGPGVDRLDVLHDQAQEAFEAQRAELVDKAVRDITSLIEAERFTAALDMAAERLGALKDAPNSGRIDALHIQAAYKREEKMRRLAEKEEKENRFRSLLKEAEREIASRDYATALALLAQARGIKETEEVELLANRARYIQFVSRGKAAEKRGDLGQAVQTYKEALTIREDPEISEKVQELQRLISLRDTLNEARTLREQQKWLEAQEKYSGALQIARDEEKEEIEELLSECSSEAAFSRLLAKARRTASEEQWERALELAEKALASKPGHPDALNISRRARRALGPEKAITNSIGMKLLLVPAGEFTVGSRNGDADEKPPHTVTLDAFYISETEVTNGQFERFMPAHRHKWKQFSPGDNMPVIAVTWDEAMAFCRWLSRKEGAEYRLPTETEWEIAARGSDGRTYPWGNEQPFSGGIYMCNYAPEKARSRWKLDGFEFVAPVGSFPNGASPFGCFDMAGNVWEWCQDWYDAGAYGDRDGAVNPEGPGHGTKRVLRGGSCTDSERVLRSSNRLGKKPGFYDANVGFRCVRTVEIYEDAE